MIFNQDILKLTLQKNWKNFQSLLRNSYAWEHKVPASEAACVLDISEEGVKSAYRDFVSKHSATAHVRKGTRILE